MGIWPSNSGEAGMASTTMGSTTLNASKSNLNSGPSTVIEKEKKVLEKIQKRQELELQKMIDQENKMEEIRR